MCAYYTLTAKVCQAEAMPKLDDSYIIQCAFRRVSQSSLTLSLDHLFTEMSDATKRWPSDKVKENCKSTLYYVAILLS